MMLLRLTGRLREDEEAEAAPAPRDSVADRLQSLEATVEEQGEATTRALHDLTRQIQKLERRLARGAPQAKAAGE
jgi:hypothetical protein